MPWLWVGTPRGLGPMLPNSWPWHGVREHGPSPGVRRRASRWRQPDLSLPICSGLAPHGTSCPPVMGGVFRAPHEKRKEEHAAAYAVGVAEGWSAQCQSSLPSCALASVPSATPRWPGKLSRAGGSGSHEEGTRRCLWLTGRAVKQWLWAWVGPCRGQGGPQALPPRGGVFAVVSGVQQLHNTITATCSPPRAPHVRLAWAFCSPGHRQGWESGAGLEEDAGVSGEDLEGAPIPAYPEEALRRASGVASAWLPRFWLSVPLTPWPSRTFPGP